MWEEVRRLTGGRGADRSFDCAGAGDTLDELIRMTAKNGKVGVIAYPKVPTTQEALYYMVKNQITVQGVRANPNCSAAVARDDRPRQGQARRLVTHTFPIEQTEQAFDTFINHKDGAVKVVIHPNGEEENE